MDKKSFGILLEKLKKIDWDEREWPATNVLIFGTVPGQIEEYLLEIEM